MNNNHHMGRRLSLKANLSYEPPPLLASSLFPGFLSLARLLSKLCPPHLASSHPPRWGGAFVPFVPCSACALLPVRHRPPVLCVLLARPLSLTHRITPFVLKSPPLPRRLGRLVLWLFLFYVHHCEFVVCLAAFVWMARFGWLLARPWLCCAVGHLFVLAPLSIFVAVVGVFGVSVSVPAAASL